MPLSSTRVAYSPARVWFAVLSLCLVLVLGGCGGTRGKGGKGGKASPALPAGQVCADLSAFPQNLEIYAAKAGKNRELISPEEQALHAEKQKSRIFRPWRVTEANKALKKSLLNNFNLRPERGYAENLQPFDMEEWANLAANADASSYPNRFEYAVTVRHTDLRAMPTNKPYFLDPRRAGEGFPFDYFQHSSLPVGTPVVIYHTSRDGQWVLAETSFTSGWIPADHAALVDETFMEKWQAAPLVALLRDKLLLREDARKDVLTGKPASAYGHIGALLPQGPGANTVYVPYRKADGKAGMTPAHLAPGDSARVPLPLTPGNIARIGNEMMNQPYGWGGLFENRDCSALTRDLFAPFGLWLPRNSATQGSWGRPVSLAGLDPAAKKERILQEGAPFLSLLWMRGHITLYLGEHNGDGAMFHNIWGLRTCTVDGEGRAVIGRAVVTGLTPGVEVPEVAAAGLLLDRIERISILPEAEEKSPVIPPKKKPAKKSPAKKSAGKKKSAPQKRSGR